MMTLCACVWLCYDDQRSEDCELRRCVAATETRGGGQRLSREDALVYTILGGEGHFGLSALQPTSVRSSAERLRAEIDAELQACAADAQP